MHLRAKLRASVNFCYFHTTKQQHHVFIPVQAESDMGEALQVNASEIIYTYFYFLSCCTNVRQCIKCWIFVSGYSSHVLSVNSLIFPFIFKIKALGLCLKSLYFETKRIN